MNDALIRKTALFGAWCAPAYCVLLLVGWWVIAGFFPLHEPAAGAAEIASFFSKDITGIRVGMIMVMWGSAVFLPFAATLADYVSRIEGRAGPLARIILMAGFANSLLTFYPPLYWLVNVFRPGERSAELIYLLNDIAWLQFVGGISLVMPMYIGLAVAVLNDRSPHPVFPRWVAFYSLLVFVLFLPDQLLFFFKTGPFAWNGLFAFWIPLTMFCSWFLTIAWLIRRDVLQSRAGTN